MKMGNTMRSGPSGPRSGLKTTVSKAGGDAGTATVTNVTVTVTGAQLTHLATISSLAALPAGLAFGSPRVSAANTVEIPVVNPTAAKVAMGTLTAAIELRTYTT
jgi:hypothetical protein